MLAHPSPASKRLAPGQLRGGYGAAAAASEVFLVPGQTWPASLMPSEASETFSGVFWSFRGLGNVQRRVLELSEPSETFSGAF